MTTSDEQWLADEGQQIANLSNLKTGMSFVDVGCGTGAVTAWLAQATGCAGLGIDPDEVAIATATAQHSDDASNLRFQVADLEDSVGSTFDVAFAVDSLSRAKDIPKALKAIGSMLTPGGRLVAPYTQLLSQPGQMDPEASQVGQALDALSWEWVALEANGLAHWQRTVDAVDGLGPDEAEHAKQMLANWQQGRCVRWLFVARPAQPEA